jgi:branched-chain amino acid transport system substrate-binding protein
MNRQWHIRFALVAAALVLIAPSLVNSTGAQGAADKSPIYIGQVVPETGVGAETGVFQLNGANLAISQINGHGGINGRPLKLEVQDDQTTNAGAVAAFQRLTQSGNVTAIIGPIRSTEVQALTPYIERAQLPVIMGGTAPALTHEGDPWVFRTRPNDSYSAKALATFVVKTLHLNKIAVIHSSDAFGEGANTSVLAALKDLGVRPVTDQSYNNHDADLTPQALRIKRSGAQALISYITFDEDGVVLARQMHQLGVHVTWAGSPSLTTVTSRRLGGELLYGTYGVTDFALGQNAASVAFDRVYRAKYHAPADLYAGYVYDGVNILAIAMRKNGTAPDAIRSGILAIKGYEGVEGTYNFDKNGDGLHQYTVVRNVKGTIRIVKVLTF